MAEAVFPVVYSTLAGEALVSRVLSCYAIDKVIRCQFWMRGLSDVYLVATRTTPYILRISHVHWRSGSEVAFELELLDFLQQRGIPVAYPLRTQTGELSVEINAPEGKRYAALFIYAPGTVPIGDLNSTQGKILGEIVAKLHGAAAEFHCGIDRQALTLEYLLDDSYQLIAPFLHYKPQELDYLSDAIAHIKQQLQHLPQEPPYWVICWGDPHSGNTHFTPENHATLFDFDQCGYGWRIFEIAKFFQVALCTGGSKAVRDAFLEGYRSVQDLAEWELQAIQPFTQVAHIWRWAISLNQALVHNYSRLDEYYFNQRIAQLKMLRSPDWQLF